VVRVVEDLRLEEGPPLWRQPEWSDRFPWLLQGTTGRGDDQSFDLGFFGSRPVGEVVRRWAELRDWAGFATAVHSRQVHEAEIHRWTDPLPPGLILTEGRDAHVASVPGVLLTVSIADCVPVFLADEEQRAVAMIHAGWRSVAADIVERGVSAIREVAGSDPRSLWLHCGPSICGECYEVGVEVHQGIHPRREPPDGPAPIDLRAAIAERALALGLEREKLTISAHCTRCGPGSFFSHRGGSPERQLGIVGVRS
jgi:polyphenol oxidase